LRQVRARVVSRSGAGRRCDRRGVSASAAGATAGRQGDKEALASPCRHDPLHPRGVGGVLARLLDGQGDDRSRGVSPHSRHAALFGQQSLHIVVDDVQDQLTPLVSRAPRGGDPVPAGGLQQ
jgi:hypothetical protein